MSKDTKGTKKYIGDIASTKVKNIFYFLFFKMRIVGKHGRENVGKAQIFFQNNKRHNKKTSWVPKRLMF
jgi:hypothetical protein